MDARIEGQVTLEFIRSGTASKSKKPYAMFANGRKEIFVNIDDDILARLSSCSEGDFVTMEVSVLAGSDSVKVLSIE